MNINLVQWRFFRKIDNPNLFLLEFNQDYPMIFKDISINEADDILKVFFWLVYKRKFSFKEWIENPKNLKYNV